MGLALLNCAGLKPFPTDKIYEFDPKVPTCAVYLITDYEKLQYEYVKDIPFAQCPAIFGFASGDIGKVTKWGRESIQYGKSHCK